MGTRNLTSVILDGETRVAQYGQWDGYPQGQGETIATFLRDADLAAFADKVRGTQFLTKAESTARITAAGLPAGAMTTEEAETFTATFPALSRDTGAEVLALILDGSVTELSDQSAFAHDRVWCEFAYSINLDDQTVTVAHGMEPRRFTTFTFAEFTAAGAMADFEKALREEDEG